MDLRPKKKLTTREVRRGLKLVIGDGLTAEAMTTLTGGAFLVSMALLLGASNFQIGLLAAIPTFTNIFQLVSIWLVRKYNNRRIITVVCLLLARIPLLIIGAMVLLFSRTSIDIIIFFLFFYYLFGSIAGPSWNAWMKDLVPQKLLGAYFSRRGSYTQTLNVILSLMLAFVIDYIKTNHREYELVAYAAMFSTAGIIGFIGAFILSNAPEPQSFMVRENIFKLLKRPLKDTNFRSLLMFNAGWTFALNIATPFFTVFMIVGMDLPLSYIIGLNILSQLASIMTIRVWGRNADKYSNKTIIAICGPLYILCLLAWCFVGIYTNFYSNIILLAAIHLLMGIATSGINLSITNIGLKLAPREASIVYLSARNIVTASVASFAPLIGGYLADYFSTRSLTINAQWVSPDMNKVFHLVSLHEWNFLFLIGAFLAFVALEFLVQVREVGEVEKDLVVKIMRSNIRNNLKEAFIVGNLITWQEQLWKIIKKKKLLKSRQLR